MSQGPGVGGLVFAWQADLPEMMTQNKHICLIRSQMHLSDRMVQHYLLNFHRYLSERGSSRYPKIFKDNHCAFHLAGFGL